MYRMNPNYGDFNSALTKAVQAVARLDTGRVWFLPHALREMDNDGFDHDEVLVCLRKGKAHGPELQSGQLRANVVHRGLHIRVVVGGLDAVHGDWGQLQSVKVVTVMRVE